MASPRLLALVLVFLASSGLSADVLVLTDGRKISGSVSKSQDEYVVRSDGKVLHFRKTLVDRWCKTPKEYLGDKEALANEAKAEFLEARRASDPAVQGEHLKAAREKNAEARHAIVETRQLFPHGYPELDRAILQIVRLDRALLAGTEEGAPEPAFAVGEAADPIAQTAYDLGAWKASGLFDVALRCLRVDPTARRDFGIEYATAYLATLDSIARKRDYEKCLDDWDAALRAAVTPREKEHVEALLAGFKAVLPCKSCLGTGKTGCTTCKADGLYDVQCNACGGAGWMLRRNVERCRNCGGIGRIRNVKCPKCDGTSTVPCKARSCRVRPEPLAFSEIADATPCAACAGEGGRFRAGVARCQNCLGLGVQLVPKFDAQKTLR